MAFDIEDNATVESMPVHCPRCGNVVRTDGILGFLSRLFGLARKSRALILVLITMISLTSCDRYQDWSCNEERMKAARAVAWDFYFYKKRFWVLDLCKDWKWRKPSCWLMNLPYVADPFLNYPDPRAEILR